MSIFVAQRFDGMVIAVGTREQCDVAIAKLNEELMDGVRYDGREPDARAGTWERDDHPLYALAQLAGYDVAGDDVTITEWMS